MWWMTDWLVAHTEMYQPKSNLRRGKSPFATSQLPPRPHQSQISLACWKHGTFFVAMRWSLQKCRGGFSDEKQESSGCCPTVPASASLHSAQAGALPISRAPSDLLLQALGKGAHVQGVLATAIRICAPLSKGKTVPRFPWLEGKS